MPWLEERTLTLFVRDTEVRRYEPGVRERGVDVDRPSGPLMGSADTDTDPDPDGALSLKAPVIHGHLIRQHFFSVASLTYLHLSDNSSDGLSRPSLFTTLVLFTIHKLSRELALGTVRKAVIHVAAVRSPTSTSTVDRSHPRSNPGDRAVKGGRATRRSYANGPCTVVVQVCDRASG